MANTAAMIARALFLLACVASTGCLPEATAPMLHPMPLTPPHVLESGDTAVSGQVAMRAMTNEAPLDAWTVAARHGFGDGVEATLDASYVHESATGRTPSTAGGMLARVGLRYNLRQDKRRAFTVFGGAGGGAYDSGALFGGDVGFVVGTDVVFFATRLSLAITSGATTIDDGYYTPACFLFCGERPPVDYRNAPHTTVALETLFGVRAVLTSGNANAIGKTAFLVGIELVDSYAAEDHLGIAVGTALEVSF